MDSTLEEAQCLVCRRDHIPRTRDNEISICRDCKSLVADDSESTPPIRNFRGRNRRRIRSIRHSSSESTDDLFSQQFSQLINLARQTQEISQLEEIMDALITPPRRPYHPPSHTETDRDSWFGESDSNFSLYGGDSETDADFSIHRDHDADIDPMHAVLNQSDDDSGTEWDEASSIRLTHLHSPQNSTLFRWRASHTDALQDLDSGDFEELLQQFTENNDLQTGAPPASASTVEKLPSVTIPENHGRGDGLVCAVCKDPLRAGSEAKQLPCMHLYHPMCILPWLKARNSCPVCRFELPTDDFEYEEVRRIGAENSSGVWSDVEVDARNEQIATGAVDGGSLRSNRGHGRRWYFAAAAAPVVSVVGIALVLWFGSGNRSQHGRLSRGARGRR